MVRKKLPKSQRQDRPIQFVASSKFKAGLKKAATAAGEPSLSEYIKKALIRDAAALGVKIER